jgi:hypothetical protein
MVRETAVPPQNRTLGRCLRASSATSFRSTRPVSLRTPYGTDAKYLPEMLTFQPWVRCPPAGSPRPMMVSPGLQNAR